MRPPEVQDEMDRQPKRKGEGKRNNEVSGYRRGFEGSNVWSVNSNVWTGVTRPASTGEGGLGCPIDDDDDFFSFETSSSTSQTSAEEVAENEVRIFLETPSSDLTLTILHSFPNLKKIFLKSNTPLPSSAAVERLFSLCGIVFSARRARLLDRNLETVVLLKSNLNIVKFSRKSKLYWEKFIFENVENFT